MKELNRFDIAIITFCVVYMTLTSMDLQSESEKQTKYLKSISERLQIVEKYQGNNK